MNGTEMTPADIITLIQQGAMWVVFLWLFLNERKRSEERMRAHNDDLREIAGLGRKWITDMGRTRPINGEGNQQQKVS